MALIERKTRKKLSKQLTKLVKRHGAEMALALVSGIVSSLATDQVDKPAKKAKTDRAKKPGKKAKTAATPATTRKRDAVRTAG